jgi:hypothetical protein
MHFDRNSRPAVLNMKTLLPLLLLATLGILAILPQSAFAQPAQNGVERSGHGTVVVFTVALRGSQQVPPVTTNAFGFVIVRLFHNGTSTAIDFRLIVCNIANVTHAHIHVGAAGTNGPIVVPFFDQPSSPVSKANGCTVLASGLRGPFDLIPRPEAGINNWADFVHALLSGNTYVNVHTIANPGGEVRGQLVQQE